MAAGVVDVSQYFGRGAGGGCSPARARGAATEITAGAAALDGPWAESPGSRARVPVKELQALLRKAGQARLAARSMARAAGEAQQRREGAEGDSRFMQQQAIALMAEKAQLSRENAELRLQQAQLREQFDFLSTQQAHLNDENEALAAENEALRALFADLGGPRSGEPCEPQGSGCLGK